jgi:hypothetical protein
VIAMAVPKNASIVPISMMPLEAGTVDTVPDCHGRPVSFAQRDSRACRAGKLLISNLSGLAVRPGRA